MEQLYNIADLMVKMDCSGRTEKQAKPYLSPQKAEPDFAISPEKVKELNKKLMAKHPELSEDMSEYYSTGAIFYRNLLNFDGLMLHSSAVVVDGKAYVFTADCGTGKSTHTTLWLKRFGDRAFILNDDKPALRREDGVWYAYGTPWSGKHDISRNVRVPLAGIAVLERGEENEVVPFGGIEAVHAIIKQVNRSKSAESRIKLMQLMDKLLTDVPVWKLRCNMDQQAAEVAYAAMSGEKLHGKEE